MSDLNFWLSAKLDVIISEVIKSALLFADMICVLPLEGHRGRKSCSVLQRLFVCSVVFLSGWSSKCRWEINLSVYLNGLIKLKLQLLN